MFGLSPIAIKIKPARDLKRYFWVNLKILFTLTKYLCYDLVCNNCKKINWRGVRVVDGDALEMRFGESQRGFESPPLR
jgi:hypothetical protein